MKRHYNYIREKLSGAIYNLVVLPGDIRKRLLYAYMEFHTLKREYFPKELQDDWEWIISQLTRYEPEYDEEGNIVFGSVENTLRFIKNKTGSKIAERIYMLYVRMKEEE